MKPIIKWTGSKRSQSKRIISYIPQDIETYYEPFLGGGSVLSALLSFRWNIKKYVVSDICKELIELWQLIQLNPTELIKSYKNNWELLQQNKEYYYTVRERFNLERKPDDFFFLSRTCVNGLIRFNKNGNFNSPFHLTRNGIQPKTIQSIILQWHQFIQPVEFICQDYRKVHPEENDWVYCDPPYSESTMYSGNIDFEKFLAWVTNLKSGYIISFNGIKKELTNKNDIIPSNYYDHKILLKSGNSPYKRVIQQKNNVNVFEYLYIKYHNQKPHFSGTQNLENLIKK